MNEALLALSVLVVSGVVAVIVYLARSQRFSERVVIALTIACAAALVLMVVSDWPSEVLSRFWADHSVLAGLLSSVLLVAVVFLAFEDSERRKQEEIDNSVTSAGLGGIVDHLVDVEVALALVTGPEPDRTIWTGWDDRAAKPLRWLREPRDRLARGKVVPGGAGPDDPRSGASKFSSDELINATWRHLLVDQCVRRLLAGIRDWSPVIQNSRNGTLMLIALAELRQDLMRLDANLAAGAKREAETLIGQLRLRCRVMALLFERLSGARGGASGEAHTVDDVDPRPEVLLDGAPLADVSELTGALGKKRRRALSTHWIDELVLVEDTLNSAASQTRSAKSTG